MKRATRLTAATFLACAVLVSLFGNLAAVQNENPNREVAILLYHRFAAVCTNEMTVRVSTFQSHLQYLREHEYEVIPLGRLVAYRLGKAMPPPARSVVITIDDDSESVYTQAFPLLKQSHVPVTLFVYPSAISNAPYALTWSELRELKQSGLFDIQSHTYWHPNFKREKQRLSSRQYDELAQWQLRRSKSALETHLGITVAMLAWPYGIHDDDLIRKATAAGYLAAFTLERHHAADSDNIMALPRYLVTDRDQGKGFQELLDGRRAER